MFDIFNNWLIFGRPEITHFINWNEHSAKIKCATILPTNLNYF